MPISCYSKEGPICKFCLPIEGSDEVYGMPRYTCVHPIEGDTHIDPDREAVCPPSYKRAELM
jgi:hypothetical protein